MVETQQAVRVAPARWGVTLTSRVPIMSLFLENTCREKKVYNVCNLFSNESEKIYIHREKNDKANVVTINNQDIWMKEIGVLCTILKIILSEVISKWKKKKKKRLKLTTVFFYNSPFTNKEIMNDSIYL